MAGGEGAGGARMVGEHGGDATNREDKWMALTFLSSQRPGQQPSPFTPYIPSPDSPFHPPVVSLFLSLSFSLLFLIWFDWRRNVALLKVAAEEQWGIVLFHTCTSTRAHTHTPNACRQTLVHTTRHGHTHSY